MGVGRVFFLAMSQRSYFASFTAQGVAPFDNIEVEFNPYLNIIAGANASGKTTLLRILTWCIHQPMPGDYRFAPDTSCVAAIMDRGQMHASGVGAGTYSEGAYRTQNVKQWSVPSSYKNVVAHASVSIAHSTDFTFAPLVIGPTRTFSYKDVQGMVREPTLDQARAKYRAEASNRLRSTSIPNPKQWLINRYFVSEKPWATHFRANWESIVEKIGALSPQGTTFAFKEIREDLEPRFELDGDEVFLEELSGGFQSILSIAFSIVEWIEATNSGDQRFVSKASGTVLIDEIDSHLHPQWQSTVIRGLRDLFPNIQIIATTHSPHVIGACQENELILIPPRSNSSRITPEPSSFVGWTTDATLRLLMNVSRLDHGNYSLLYNAVLEHISSGTIEDFTLALDRLAAISAPDDTLIENLRTQMTARVARDAIGKPE